MPPSHHHHQSLPESHLANIRSLEQAYLAHDDPIRQSGFSGGAERWQIERSPLLDAVDSDGDFLDVGCANGYLLECVVKWASKRGFVLTPYGVDLNPRLILEATRRLSNDDDLYHHFWVANVWGWIPPRRFKWAYMINDCVPDSMLGDWCKHMLKHGLSDDGVLIIGNYGSVSERRAPMDIAEFLRSQGLHIAGDSCGGELPDIGDPVTRFAWMKRADNLS